MQVLQVTLSLLWIPRLLMMILSKVMMKTMMTATLLRMLAVFLWPSFVMFSAPRTRKKMPAKTWKQTVYSLALLEGLW